MYMKLGDTVGARYYPKSIYTNQIGYYRTTIVTMCMCVYHGQYNGLLVYWFCPKFLFGVKLGTPFGVRMDDFLPYASLKMLAIAMFSPCLMPK